MRLALALILTGALCGLTTWLTNATEINGLTVLGIILTLVGVCRAVHIETHTTDLEHAQLEAAMTEAMR
jgi:hypothetical protein